MKILIIHGPNLNLLGLREPEQYGTKSLQEIDAELYAYSFELGLDVEIFQSNFEGEIIEKIQNAIGEFDGILINAAGYTHTSISIRDAIAAVGIATIEIHMTNIYKREAFRQKSLLSDVCIGQISGFLSNSYNLGLKAMSDHLKAKNKN